MGLDPIICLMIDGTDAQVALELFEGLFHFGQLGIILPEVSRILVGQIGAQ